MKAEKHFDRLPKEERQLIALMVAKAIYEYLQLFLSPVIARRIISAILIIAGVHSTDITQLTGLCERSIRDLKNQIAAGNTDSLFETRSGRGRKFKFKDVELKRSKRGTTRHSNKSPTWFGRNLVSMYPLWLSAGF